jgi:urease accessory protein
MRNMMRRIACTASLALLVTVFSTAAFAHPGDHTHVGFATGFAHPLTGLDHLLAMVAVGLWASQLGGRALWLLPLTFPVVMAAGAALGFAGVALPWVEVGVTASVLVLGAAIALTYRPSLAVSLPLIGLFGLLHGYAHGVELPAQASALGYGAGFITATLALHLAGLAIGLAANRLPVRFAARTAGGAIAAVGAVLLVTV